MMQFNDVCKSGSAPKSIVGQVRIETKQGFAWPLEGVDIGPLLEAANIELPPGVSVFLDADSFGGTITVIEESKG